MLIANLSISDMKHIKASEDFENFLHMSAETFLQQTKGMLVKDPIFCQHDLLFLEVVRMFPRAHVHHVFLVDNNRKPLAVIGTGDIISALKSLQGHQSK